MIWIKRGLVQPPLGSGWEIGSDTLNRFAHAVVVGTNEAGGILKPWV